MVKKSLVSKNREAAFRTYCSCGGNVAESVKELKRKGPEISERTLRAWVKRFNFERRLARVDLLLVAHEKGTLRGTMVLVLFEQVLKYVSYLESVEIDPQATYAMLHIIRMINKELPPELNLEEGLTEEKAREVLRDVYGIGGGQ